MNANELLDIIGEARSPYILEAQKHRVPKRRTAPAKQLLLIAVVLTLLVALVGFAAIVFDLDDLILGGYTSENYKGEQVEMDVISLQGYTGSKNYLAAKEWQEFLQTDVGRAVNNDYRAPRAYDGYLCTNKYMAQKVDEICKKYGLELLGAWTLHQSMWETCEAVGINSIFNTDAHYTVENDNGYHYSGGSFEVEAVAILQDAPWNHPITFEFLNIQKTSFDGVFISVPAHSDYTQWNYTTESGTELLMALSTGHALMFCDRQDSFITVNVSTQYGEEYMDQADLEAFADTLDFGFTVHPTPVTDDSAAPVTTETPVGTAYYSDYADYITDLLDAGAVVSYAIEQVDGRDEYELIIFEGNGTIREILTIRDGYVQTMAKGGNLYLCDYVDTSGLYVTDPNYVYIFRVIEQVSETADGVLHYYTYINEEGIGVILGELTEAEHQALNGQYERLTIDRKYIGEFFGEHTPDYTLFRTAFLPIAGGEVPTDWDSINAFLTEQGYTCTMGEGTWSVTDPMNPDSYLMGDLTTANGILELADVRYQLTLGDAVREVQATFRGDGAEFIVNGGALRDGVCVPDLGELQQFIEDLGK